MKILLILSVCVMACCAMGCSTSDEEEMDTGTCESGTVYYNNYKIDITGPKVGAPSGEILWSTYYEADDSDVNVDFYGKEGSIEERIEELEAGGKEVSRGVLWGNECQFYMDESLIVMIPLGEDGYLQVEFTHEGDGLEEMTRTSDGFTLIIEKAR